MTTDADSKRTPHKRRRGAQPSNTNALKHGLYARVLPAIQQAHFIIAETMDPKDLQHEIEILRVVLAELIRQQTTGDGDALDTERYIDVLCKLTREIARAIGKEHALTTAEGDDRLDEAADLLQSDLKAMLLGDDAT